MNVTSNTIVSKKVETAQTLKQRAVGLLGRSELVEDHCLWILKCRSVHSFFLRFPIDVLYVDKDLRITKIEKNMKSWRISWGGFSSSSCFEFGANQVGTTVNVGDLLSVSS